MRAATRAELERLYARRHELDLSVWQEETLQAVRLNRKLSRVGAPQLRLPRPPRRRTVPDRIVGAEPQLLTRLCGRVTGLR